MRHAPDDAVAAPQAQATPRLNVGRKVIHGRPQALLGALITGALLAAVGAAPWSGRGVEALPDGGTSVAAALELSGDSTDADSEVFAQAQAQAQISQSEAAARLELLAASRAERIERERPQAVLPVQGVLTSSFGARWGTTHNGLDFGAPMLTQEVAAADGVVVRAGTASGFGLAVYIQHPNGDVTVYGHMETIQVRAGDIVAAGDPIALLGNRGQSTGPHLHFEVHQGGMNGPRLDPAQWLADRGVQL